MSDRPDADVGAATRSESDIAVLPLADDQPGGHVAEPSAAEVEHVFRWDLDKTYLATEFDKVADLVRTFMQKAEEKRNVPGALPLLRALLKPRVDRVRRAVYFISGSPRQMRRVLQRKLELDGIQPDAFILKPNLQNLLRLRFRALRGQVGYKLRALLEHQLPGPGIVPETLFGDDAEQDAAIYSIYGEILAGRLRGGDLEQLLVKARVYRDNVDAILTAADTIAPAERVRRIYIILDRKSPPQRFRPYLPRLVPVYNYFQAALCLYQDGLLETRDIIEISLDMMERDGYNPFALTNSMQDVVRRGHLQIETTRGLAAELREDADVEVDEIARRMLDEFAARIRELDGYTSQLPDGPVDALDWAELLDLELEARERHKEEQKKLLRSRRRSIFDRDR